MSKPNPTLRATIAAEMQRQGVTQAELSRRCGGAPAQGKISQFLAGRAITTANLEKIINVLGLTLANRSDE